MGPRIKVWNRETLYASVDFVVREVRLPSQAQVERQALRDFPVVVNEISRHPGVRVLELALCLLELEQIAEYEIRGGVASGKRVVGLPRKREQAGRVETVIEFHLAPLQIEADGEVVLANHPTDGVVADEVIPREAGEWIVAEGE